jgi:hypothetical protein
MKQLNLVALQARYGSLVFTNRVCNTLTVTVRVSPDSYLTDLGFKAVVFQGLGHAGMKLSLELNSSNLGEFVAYSHL